MPGNKVSRRHTHQGDESEEEAEGGEEEKEECANKSSSKKSDEGSGSLVDSSGSELEDDVFLTEVEFYDIVSPTPNPLAPHVMFCCIIAVNRMVRICHPI